MKLQLFISHAFAPCRDAEFVWNQVAHEHDVALGIVDIDSPGGRDLAERMRVTVVPAIAVDNRLLAIGVQTIAEARDLMASVGGMR